MNLKKRKSFIFFYFPLFTLYSLFSISNVLAAPNISSDVFEHWAWNDIIGWIDFYSTNNVNVAISKIEGYADSSAGSIAFDCATSPNGNICGASNFEVSNDGAGNLSGFAWSESIGWISFYCGDLDLVPPICDQFNYRVTIDGAGNFSGWAWNDSVGWISFNCNNSGIGDTLSRGFLQGSQMLTLKFSRTQELQADDLGIQYLQGAGYDMRAMSTVLTSLAAQNALDSRLQGSNASIPQWASTHPDPASRVQTALAKAAGQPAGATRRDLFLAGINGLIYGDDPQQGVIEGSRFIHPELRLTFTAPQGFYMVNSTRAVSINGQSGKAQMTMAAYNGNLADYVRQQFATLGGTEQNLRPSNVQSTTVNGIPAAYGTARVASGSSQVDVMVFAYEFASDRAYHFAAIVPAGQTNPFAAMFQSMRRISATEAGNVVARRLDVVTVQRGDTVQSLANRMAYDDAKEERFRVLNAIGTNDTLAAGQKVKLVVRAR